MPRYLLNVNGQISTVEDWSSPSKFLQENHNLDFLFEWISTSRIIKCMIYCHHCVLMEFAVSELARICNTLLHFAHYALTLTLR